MIKFLDTLRLVDYVSFFVPGVPIAKQRARTCVTKEKLWHYTPDRTRNYESQISFIAKAATKGYPPLDCPVYLNLTFYMPQKVSLAKWQSKLIEKGLLWPTVKPDADNMEKAIKDACNQIVWLDDAYVIGCSKIKRYATHENEVGVQVTVKKVAGYAAQTKKIKVAKDHLM